MTLEVRAPNEGDRWRLLTWRNSERVRRFSINDRPIEPGVHTAWFDRLLAEQADRFLVVTWNGEPGGVVQLEKLDPDQGVGSWACHLGETATPPGVGACLPLIGLALGFGRFGLRRMTAQVLASNRNMASMLRRFGIPEEGRRREHVRRNGGDLDDVLEFGVLRSEWRDIMASGSRLLPQRIRDHLAKVTAELVGATTATE